MWDLCAPSHFAAPALVLLWTLTLFCSTGWALCPSQGQEDAWEWEEGLLTAPCGHSRLCPQRSAPSSLPQWPQGQGWGFSNDQKAQNQTRPYTSSKTHTQIISTLLTGRGKREWSYIGATGLLPHNVDWASECPPLGSDLWRAVSFSIIMTTVPWSEMLPEALLEPASPGHICFITSEEENCNKRKAS